MKKSWIIGLVVVLMLALGFYLINLKISNGSLIESKYYCSNSYDCVDGSYCEKTDDGCVGFKWWNKNVGYKYDCLPNPYLCSCINNKCVKKSALNSSSEVDPRCSLEPQAGPCKAYIPKYYFDQNEKICKEFIWGGCYGIVPFESLKECQESCK